MDALHAEHASDLLVCLLAEQDWEKERARIGAQKERGLLAEAYGGDLFTRMLPLRDFENLMMDFATDDPHLSMGLDMIVEHDLALMCVNIRLNPQALPFVTPQQVHEMVRETVETMGDPAGGLWLDCNLCSSDVPMENLEAICAAFEEFCFR